MSNYSGPFGLLFVLIVMGGVLYFLESTDRINLVGWL